MTWTQPSTSQTRVRTQPIWTHGTEPDPFKNPPLKGIFERECSGGEADDLTALHHPEIIRMTIRLHRTHHSLSTFERPNL